MPTWMTLAGVALAWFAVARLRRGNGLQFWHVLCAVLITCAGVWLLAHGGHGLAYKGGQ